MMENQKYPASVAIIGGDGRMIYTKEALEADGCMVTLWGHPNEAESVLADVLLGAELVILPIPLTRDGGHLNTPASPPKLSELADWMKAGQVVALGSSTDEFTAALKKKGCVLLEYGKSDAYAIPNALATAEGAIALAITRSKELLMGASAAILGFGRIGKQLCRLLIALGVKVTVFARREADLAYAKTMGAESLPIGNVGEKLGRYGLVFNTVPQKLLTASDFAHLKEDALVFDLAPIYEAAEDEWIIRCPSIPYQFSPKSAGELIYTCVRDLWNRGEWMV